MSTLTDFIKRHPVATYFVLTFAISWAGFVLVATPGGFASTNWLDDSSFTFVVMAMLAGPTVAGLFVTAITDGKAGLRKLFSSLLKWRVSLGWYVVAL